MPTLATNLGQSGSAFTTPLTGVSASDRIRVINGIGRIGSGSLIIDNLPFGVNNITIRSVPISGAAVDTTLTVYGVNQVSEKDVALSRTATGFSDTQQRLMASTAISVSAGLSDLGLKDGATSIVPPIPTPTPTPTGSLISDAAYQQMRTDTPQGEALFTVSNASATPTIADSRFAVGAPTSAGVYPINRGTGAVTPNTTIFVTVQAGSDSVIVPVEVKDRVARRQLYRNVLPQKFRQALIDMQVAEHERMHAGITLPAFTHTAIKDGNADDPTVWSTGTVPDLWNPISKSILNPHTGAQENRQTGTASVNFSMRKVRVRSHFRVKAIHQSGRGKVTFRPEVGALDMETHADTGMFHGTVEAIETVSESSAPGGRRIAFITVPHASMDPTNGSLSRGWHFMGPTTFQGKKKADVVWPTLDLAAGATSFTIQDLAASGIRVGDKLIFPDTKDAEMTTDPAIGIRCTLPVVLPATFAGHSAIYGVDFGANAPGEAAGPAYRQYGWARSFADHATVTGINTTTGQVTFSPALTYAHTTRTGTWTDPYSVKPNRVETHLPRVLCPSRNIAFYSADPNTRLNRGHVMIMDWRATHAWIESLEMGRTLADLTMTVPVGGDTLYADATKAVTFNDLNNPIGAYGWHYHFCGLKVGQTIQSEGLSIHAPLTKFLGTGLSVHMSRGIFRRMIVDDFTGKSVMTENGPEWTQFEDCNVGGATGDGYVTLAVGDQNRNDKAFRDGFKRNGYEGAGWDMQSRAVVAKNCHTYGCTVHWTFEQQGNLALQLGIQNWNAFDPQTDSLISTDPWISRKGEFAGNNTTQLPGSGPWYASGVERATLPEGIYGYKDAPIQLFEGNTGANGFIGLRINGREYADRASGIATIFSRYATFGIDNPVRMDTYVHHYVYVEHMHSRNTIKPGTNAFYYGSGVIWAQTAIDCAGHGYDFGFFDGGIWDNFDGDWIGNDMSGCTTPFHQKLIDSASFAAVNANPQNHPNYNRAGPWLKPDGTPIGTTYPAAFIIRQWRNRTAGELSGTPYPAGLVGLKGVNPSYLSGTGIAFDPAQTITINCADPNPVDFTFKGAVRDSLNLHQMGESGDGQHVDNPVTVVPSRAIAFRTALEIVDQNGFWNDAGTYKVRMHETRRDRWGANALMHGYKDLPVINIPAAMMTTHLLSDPNATRQTDFLQLEQLDLRPQSIDQSAPMITSAIPATYYNAPEEPLRIQLRADRPSVSWVIGGTDAAQFALRKVNGLSSLMFAADAKPTLADFNVTVAVMDAITGVMSAAKPVHVIVNSTSAAATQTLTDKFTDYTGDVGGHKAWLATYVTSPRVVGLSSNGNGTATLPASGPGEAANLHDSVSRDCFFEYTCATTNFPTQVPVWLGRGAAGSYFYVWVKQGSAKLSRAGAETMKTVADAVHGPGVVVGVEMSRTDGRGRVYFNGVLKYDLPITFNDDTASQCGFYNGLDDFSGGLIASARSGPGRLTGALYES